METLSLGFQRHHLGNPSTPLSRSNWRRSRPNGAWLHIASRGNHILTSKLTYLFRGIPPGFSQPLADYLTHLYRETCEILAQCETIPDISFDRAQIREDAGLGYADDLLDSAFAASSRIASLRSIEQVNPGYLDTVKAVFTQKWRRNDHCVERSG